MIRDLKALKGRILEVLEDDCYLDRDFIEDTMIEHGLKTSSTNFLYICRGIEKLGYTWNNIEKMWIR